MLEVSHCYLCVKDPDNVMFNQFWMYILSEIPKMQNMKSFAVHEHTDIDELVPKFKLLPNGSRVYCFSKELISYMETLVAFLPYYRVNDLCMVGHLDQYYADTLAAYGEVSYKTFHNKLASKMKAWYKRFPPVPPEPVADDEGEPLGQVLSGEPATLATGGSQVRQAMLWFNTEDDGNVVTHSEQPAQQSTDSPSGVTS